MFLSLLTIKMLFGYDKIEHYGKISLKLNIYHGACATYYYYDNSEKVQRLYANATTLLRMRSVIDNTYLMYTENKMVTIEQRNRYLMFLGLASMFFDEVEKLIDMDEYMEMYKKCMKK